MKKIFWTILSILIFMLVGYLLLMRFAPNAIPTDMPVIGKMFCSYPVRISGNSMSPALESGKVINFNRCMDDKSNLSAGTIIAFQGEGVVRISRIIEKISGTAEIQYKTAQDNRANDFIIVNANQIIAIY